MKIIRNAIAAGLLAGAAVAACSSQHGSTSATGTNTNGTPAVGATNGAQGNIGKVKMAWQIAGGINVTSMNWTIKDSANTYTGTDNFGDAQSAEFVAGGILAACDYTLNITATDSNNDPCDGSVALGCVVPGSTTYSSLIVTCHAPTDAAIATQSDTGSVAVDAGIVIQQIGAYTCPAINSFSISPAEISGSSQAAAVSISTIGPANPTIAWTVSGCRDVVTGNPVAGTANGFFSDPALTVPDSSHANEFFSCGSCVGQVTVTARVESLQVKPGTDAGQDVCQGTKFTTFTGLVNCESGAFSCPPNVPNVCPTNVCVNFSNDNSNCGSCGHTCTGGTSCVASSCACPAGSSLSNGICCPTGQTACGAPLACVDTTTSTQFCGPAGTCGSACPAGNTCSGGACQAQPPTACTTAPCSASGPNSVKCSGSPNGVCTATEAAIVARDISKGNLTAGQLKPTSCYKCLNNFNCIDNSFTTGNECGDVPSSFMPTGTSAGKTASQACLDTLNCTFTNVCATGNPDLQCYCGTFSGPTCNTMQNGPCQVLEANGLGFPPSDGTDVQTQYNTTSLSSGMANTIFSCAFSNSCANCLN